MEQPVTVKFSDTKTSLFIKVFDGLFRWHSVSTWQKRSKEAAR